MFAICAGMFRSGSTLQYQIASHLIERWRDGKRIGFIDLDCLPEFRQEVLDNRWRVLKVHDWHHVLAGIVAEGRAVCFYTYRDIRDVVYSIMHKRAETFDQVADLLPKILENDRAWRSQPHTLVQRYETAIHDQRRAIGEMADFLGLTLSAEDVREIADCYSLDANLARTKQFAARLQERGVDLDDARNVLHKDSHSQLHWNHIRTQPNRTWRDCAADGEIEALRPLCAQWLIDNGYEADDQW